MVLTSVITCDFFATQDRKELPGLHFTDGETKAQRGRAPCPGSHSTWGQSQDPVADSSALWSAALQALCWVLETQPWPRQRQPTLPRLSVPWKRQAHVQFGLTRAALGWHKQRGTERGPLLRCSGRFPGEGGRATQVGGTT